MDIREVSLIRHGDERGQLIAIESGKEIPFEIKRVYYIFDTLPHVRRGFHAHKTLQQFLFCPTGSCKIHFDDGTNSQETVLDSPDKGLLLRGVIWREMYDFTPSTVLAVLASEAYDETDYIRDYDQFLAYVKQQEGQT